MKKKEKRKKEVEVPDDAGISIVQGNSTSQFLRNRV